MPPVHHVRWLFGRVDIPLSYWLSVSLRCSMRTVLTWIQKYFNFVLNVVFFSFLTSVLPLVSCLIWISWSVMCETLSICLWWVNRVASTCCLFCYLYLLEVRLLHWDTISFQPFLYTIYILFLTILLDAFFHFEADFFLLINWFSFRYHRRRHCDDALSSEAWFSMSTIQHNCRKWWRLVI